jgi:Tectonin domain
MPGQALHLAMGADGTVCHVGLSNRVYRWVGGQWQEMPTDNRAAQVALGNAGAIWYVDLDNHFFRWNGTAFDPIYNLPT